MKNVRYAAFDDTGIELIVQEQKEIPGFESLTPEHQVFLLSAIENTRQRHPHGLTMTSADGRNGRVDTRPNGTIVYQGYWGPEARKAWVLFDPNCREANLRQTFEAILKEEGVAITG
jgi:hypothetical protein